MNPLMFPTRNLRLVAFMLVGLFEGVACFARVENSEKPTPYVRFIGNPTGAVGTTVKLALSRGGSSGIVTWAVQNETGQATISGNSMSLINRGTVRVTATLSEDADFASASFEGIFTITSPPSIISYQGLTSGNAGSTIQFEVAVTGSTGSISHQIENLTGLGVLDGKNVKLLSPGVIKLITILKGDSEFEGAKSETLIRINANDGNSVDKLMHLYGTTAGGGANGTGLIFQSDADFTQFTTLHNFQASTTGYTTEGGTMVQLNDGTFLGTLSSGGLSGVGVIFQYDASQGNFEVIHSFNNEDGANPSTGLMKASNGRIYGFTLAGGLSSKGTVFSIDPTTKQVAKEADFNSTIGSFGFGHAGTAAEYNGKLYGATSREAGFGRGSIFSFDLTTKVLGISTDIPASISGTAPNVAIVGSKLYAISDSKVFEVELTNNVLVEKTSYNQAIGYINPCGFTEANGKLYTGFLFADGTGGGSIVEYDPIANTLTKKLTLFAAGAGGGFVQSKFSLGPNGKLYGVSNNGGTFSTGVIFEYQPGATTLTNLYNFPKVLPNALGVPGGSAPSSAVFPTSDGKLIGIATAGGKQQRGALYEFNVADRIYTKKVDFDLAKEGELPTNINYRDGKISGVAAGGNTGSITYQLNVQSKDFSVVELGPVNWSIFGSQVDVVAHPNGKIYQLCGTCNSDFSRILEADFTTSSNNTIYNFTDDGFKATNLFELLPNGNIAGQADGLNSNTQFLYEFDPSNKSLQEKAVSTIGNIPNYWTRGLDKEFYGLNAGSRNIISYQSETRKLRSLVDLRDLPTPETAGGDLTTLFGSVYLTVTARPDLPNGGILRIDTATLNTSIVSALPQNPNSGVKLTALPSGKILIRYQDGGAKRLGAIYSYDLLTSSTNLLFEFEGTNGQRPSGNFSLQKAGQTINFNAINSGTINSSIQLLATASSGLPIQYISSDPTIATIEGTTAKLLRRGQVTIKANQAGNLIFDAALPVSQSLSVREPQAITFDQIADVEVNSVIDLAATASSGLAISYNSNDRLSIQGTKAHANAEGLATVVANQLGNIEFLPAPAVSRTFCVNPKAPTIVASDLTSLTPLLTSSASNGNQWYLNGEKIAGATGQVLLVSKSGGYTVTSQVEACVSKPSSVSVIEITGLVPELGLPQVYPSPTIDNVYTDAGDQPATIEVFDMTGRLVSRQINQTGHVTISLESCPPGVFVLVLRSNTHNLRFRVVKK